MKLRDLFLLLVRYLYTWWFADRH